MPFTSSVSNDLTLLKRWLETSVGVISPKLKMGQLVLVTFIEWKQDLEGEEGREKSPNECKRIRFPSS